MGSCCRGVLVMNSVDRAILCPAGGQIWCMSVGIGVAQSRAALVSFGGLGWWGGVLCKSTGLPRGPGHPVRAAGCRMGRLGGSYVGDFAEPRYGPTGLR